MCLVLDEILVGKHFALLHMYYCTGLLCVKVSSFIISRTLFPEIDVDDRMHSKRQQVNMSTSW